MKTVDCPVCHKRMIPVVRRDWFTYRHYCEIVEKWLYSNGNGTFSTRVVRGERHHRRLRLVRPPPDTA